MLEEETWSRTGDDDCCWDSNKEEDCRDRAEKAEIEANSWAASKQERRILRQVIVKIVGCCYCMLLMEIMMRDCTVIRSFVGWHYLTDLCLIGA